MDPLLDDLQVSRVVKRARSTLQKDRVTGTGIPFVRIGRLVRYRQSDVEAWLAARRSTPHLEGRQRPAGVASLKVR